MIRNKILIGIIAIIAVILIVTAALLIRVKIEQGKLSPARSEVLENGIVVINDSNYVNMYLLPCNNGYIAIDTGSNINAIKNELEILGIDASSVKAVLLTHTDYDHTNTLDLFKNSRVYISSVEEKMINGEINRFAFLKNKLETSYFLIKDREIIDIFGVKIQGILNPGHTKGAMSFLTEDSLFTGDALGFNGTSVVPFNKIFNMDSNEAIDSIKKIIAPLLNVKTVYTGHHGYFNITDKTYINFIED